MGAVLGAAAAGDISSFTGWDAALDSSSTFPAISTVNSELGLSLHKLLHRSFKNPQVPDFIPIL
jgi:hypothetical protein